MLIILFEINVLNVKKMSNNVKADFLLVNFSTTLFKQQSCELKACVDGNADHGREKKFEKNVYSGFPDPFSGKS